MSAGKTLAALFAYNDWARDKLLAGVAELGDEQLDRPFEIGPGTLRETLRHLYGAERIWFERWQGPGCPQFPHSRDITAIEELWQANRDLAAARNDCLAGLSQDDLHGKITYAIPNGQTHSTVLYDILLHVCNHGVHHRAQALNMLRRVGGRLANIGQDYLFYRAELPTVEYDAETRGQLREMGIPARDQTASPDTLDVTTIQKYFRYGDWAQHKVQNLAAALSDEQLDRAFEIGVGKLRKTLLHIRDAEASWSGIWEGEPASGFEQLPETTSLTELAALFNESAIRRDGYLAAVADDDLQRVVKVEPRPGSWLSFRLGETMLQLWTHGTHHRAQAVNMLRHLGVAPPELDYVDYVHESGAG